MGYKVILSYQVETYLNELNNPVKPEASLLCEEVNLFFSSLFYILYSLTFIIRDLLVKQ